MRALAILFFSGASALVYQTLWVRQLGLVVGIDVYAVTTAVAAFFAGLALGSSHFAFAMVVMVAIDLPLTLVAIAPLPVVYLVGVRLRNRIFPLQWVVTARQAGDAS